MNTENLDYEILIGEGDNPSEQRNQLAKIAEGEWLLFLDDDSKPSSNLLIEYKNVIANFSDAVVVGGPSLLMCNQLAVSKFSKVFFSSQLGIGPFLSRYNQIGELRNTHEYELILCNMLIKKDLFLESGGFNKNFFPGEENEYLTRVKQKKNIFYHPHAFVSREPRKTLWRFFVQMFNYGLGRAKHFSHRKKIPGFVFFIPLAFVFYILLAVFLFSQIPLLLFVPLLVYFFSICWLSFKTIKSIRLPLFFFLGHMAYGTGILSGLIKQSIFGSSERKLSYFQVRAVKKFNESDLSILDDKESKV
jgi:GT2 family glycosyltransferase